MNVAKGVEPMSEERVFPGQGHGFAPGDEPGATGIVQFHRFTAVILGCLGEPGSDSGVGGYHGQRQADSQHQGS